MKPSSRDTQTHPPRDRAQPARQRDEALERRRERARRISADQMAAPSMRTWRRSGTFGSSR